MTKNTRLDFTVESLVVPVTGYYAVATPHALADTAPALVVALHGWGQNAKKILRDLAPLLDHNIIVAAPQAPHPFYLDVATGKVGFHWLTRFERDQAVADANVFLARLLEVLREKHPFDPRRVFLLGFSQGCSMAWRFCVSGAVAPAGMIACGADLPTDVTEKLPGHAPFPALLVHGKEDAIISHQKMLEAQEALTALGLPHTTYEFEGGHEIPPHAAKEIAAWITAR